QGLHVLRALVGVVLAVDRVVLLVDGHGETGNLDLVESEGYAVGRRDAVRRLAARRRQLDPDLDCQSVRTATGGRAAAARRHENRGKPDCGQLTKVHPLSSSRAMTPRLAGRHRSMLPA